MAHTVMPRTRASCNTPITSIRPPRQHQASLAPWPDVARHAALRAGIASAQHNRFDPCDEPPVVPAAFAGAAVPSVAQGRAIPANAPCELERPPAAAPCSVPDERVPDARATATVPTPFGPVFSANEITATRWLLKTLRDEQLFLVPPEGINAPGCVIDDGLLTRLARIRVICRVDAGPFGIIVTSA
ncbi:hypothetical protein [Aurantimonas sp. NFXS3]|uniref:hypothetical protein n=1 Tax=Aurantimonas sp. NFXS3 TaxID=2818434 RepID=UPI003B8E1A64